MLVDSRQALAERQAELVRALVLSEPIPQGFDVTRVAAASLSLIHKRLREVARVWPCVRESLGDDYRGLFLDYARRMPPPAGGPLADGLAFAQQLDVRLSDPARAEMLRALLHWKITAQGVRPRRGFYFRAIRVKGGWLVAIRIPRVFERILSIGY